MRRSQSLSLSPDGSPCLCGHTICQIFHFSHNSVCLFVWKQRELKMFWTLIQFSGLFSFQPNRSHPPGRRVTIMLISRKCPSGLIRPFMSWTSFNCIQKWPFMFSQHAVALPLTLSPRGDGNMVCSVVLPLTCVFAGGRGCGRVCIHSPCGVSQASPGRCTPGWRPSGPASCSTAGRSSRASLRTSAASMRTSTRRSCSRTACRSCSRSCESARFFSLHVNKKLISGTSNKPGQGRTNCPTRH